MSSERSYLDHNATSPLRPEARAAMLEAMELVGNPSSVHAEGRAAKALMERARRQVASLCGAKPEQVVFTSGGTEANNLVLRPERYERRLSSEESVDAYLTSDFLGDDRHGGENEQGFDFTADAPFVFASSIEHPSVLAPLTRDDVFRVKSLPVSGPGTLDTDRAIGIVEQVLGSTEPLVGEFEDMVEPDEVLSPQEERELRTELENAKSGPGEVFLATVMTANNETGVEQPVSEFAALVRSLGGSLHADAVQCAGKSPLDLAHLAVDFLTISAHKFGGPKGVGGAIVQNSDYVLQSPIFVGGGQEQGLRAGTENLIGIAGFGAAAEAAERDLDDFAKLADWRDEIEAAVARQTSDVIVIAQASPRLPNTSCIALPGVPAETLVMALDLEGVAVSAGSACSSGKVTRSHVLEAMGLPDEISGSAIRVSLGWNSSKKDVDHFVKAWATVTHRLARTKS